MSTTPRPPLLSDDDIEAYADNWNKGVRGITITHRIMLIEGMDRSRTIYEAARAKDAELIQMLVDALEQSRMDGRGSYSITMLDALDAAAAAGFKPSEP